VLAQPEEHSKLCTSCCLGTLRSKHRHMNPKSFLSSDDNRHFLYQTWLDSHSKLRLSPHVRCWKTLPHLASQSSRRRTARPGLATYRTHRQWSDLVTVANHNRRIELSSVSRSTGRWTAP
jgi:hypothetical protein